MEQFTKQNLDAVRTAIQNELDKVGRELGLSIQLLNITFNEFEFQSKIKAKIPGKAKDYSEVYKFLKLPKIGTTFVSSNGSRMTVIEHAPNRPKFPIITQDETGRKFKYTSETVNQILARQNPITKP